MFTEPMYACPLPNKAKNPKAKEFILEPNTYVAEEKYDGIRIVTEINSIPDKLFVPKGITAWSRYGNLRPHPEHIQAELAKFPDCLLDGELCAPGKRSYGTMDLDNTAELVYMVFDILQLDGNNYTGLDYEFRRETLEDLFKEVSPSQDFVALTPIVSVNTWEDVYFFRDKVWEKDGEGLILKRLDGNYISGKRPKNNWIKIKKLQSAVLTVIGFQPSRGLILERGPYAMVTLKDEDGIITQVKTKNDALCREAEELGKGGGKHPWIGRKLRIEFQERTPDNSYRHGRWDRWENE